MNDEVDKARKELDLANKAEFAAMDKAHDEMIVQLKIQTEKIDATIRTLNLMSAAFVDNDFVRHRISQIAEFEREDGRKKLYQYLIQGLALSAVLSVVLFIGTAVLSRFVNVTLPSVSTGATK